MCKEKLLMFLNAVGLKCCLDTIRGLTKTCEYKNNISYGKKKKTRRRAADQIKNDNSKGDIAQFGLIYILT